MPSGALVGDHVPELTRSARHGRSSYRVGGDQDSSKAATPQPPTPWQRRSRDDGLERAGELHPDLGLLLGGEDVDDAVERLGGVVGVQRGEDEVTGLGDGEREPDGLEVAHLADEEDVGVLAQDAAAARRGSGGVGADLALVDRRPACGRARTRSGPRW